MKYPATLIIAALFCRTAVVAPEPVLTARAGGQSKPTPRFRRQMRAQFKPSHHPKCSGWAGPDAALTMQSERTGIENKWFALTGRVVELKATYILRCTM
jgi:hypothetical protein